MNVQKVPSVISQLPASNKIECRDKTALEGYVVRSWSSLRLWCRGWWTRHIVAPDPYQSFVDARGKLPKM